MLTRARARKIGLSLILLRETRQQSQTSVAEALGISRRTICHIEAGEIKSMTPGNLALIRAYMQCPDLASLRRIIAHETVA